MLFIVCVRSHCENYFLNCLFLFRVCVCDPFVFTHMVWSRIARSECLKKKSLEIYVFFSLAFQHTNIELNIDKKNKTFHFFFVYFCRKIQFISIPFIHLVDFALWLNQNANVMLSYTNNFVVFSSCLHICIWLQFRAGNYCSFS